MERPLWELHETVSPLIAVAIHAGGDLRPEVARVCALDAPIRRMEEDPFTGGWTEIADTRIVVHRSRFETDLNRSRAASVYLSADAAWGLEVWRSPLAEDVLERSRQQHDAFYTMLEGVLRRAAETYGRFVVYDLHSYNHRRDSADAGADPALNPDINVGTGTMKRALWAPVVDRVIDDLAAFDGGRFDVRENVRFRGGYLPRWVHETFPETGCVLAVEVKKFYMDEHTGELDPHAWSLIREGLAATTDGVLEELDRL